MTEEKLKRKQREKEIVKRLEFLNEEIKIYDGPRPHREMVYHAELTSERLKLREELKNLTKERKLYGNRT